MKICYLADINNYHTKKWCNYFLSRGHEVIIISLSQGEIPGCKSYCFNFKDVKKLNTIKKIGYLHNLRKIKKILDKEKPDILHSHYVSSYGLIGVLTGYKPHIVSLWGSDILLFPKKSFIHKFIISRILNSKTHIFSTSKYMIREADKYFKGNKDIYLTPFGVNLNLFQPRDINNSKSFIIGVNKSLEKISGIDLLLKAFSQILADNKDANIELRIAGEGSQRESLIKLAEELHIKENVKFYGFLNQKEIVLFLQELDIAIYPSLSESFGVAAVEAQACGIPVIASDVDGFKESTVPGETSLLFENGNTVDLKNKILSLYKDENKRESMKLKGLEYVRKNFDIESNFSFVFKYYCKIIDEYNGKN